MLGLGLSIPQVSVRGGGHGEQGVQLIYDGYLSTDVALTRTTTATYWGL